MPSPDILKIEVIRNDIGRFRVNQANRSGKTKKTGNYFRHSKTIFFGFFKKLHIVL